MVPYIISLFLLGISFVLVEYAVGFRFKKSLARILYSVNNKLEPVAWFILLVVFLITTYYVWPYKGMGSKSGFILYKQCPSCSEFMGRSV